MLFFLLLVCLTALFFPLSRIGVPALHDWPARMRMALAVSLLLIGLDHWLTPGRYLPMMPDWLPAPLELVLFTGACEIAGAAGLLVPRLRRLAGFMLAVYFVAVFPANVHNALHSVAVEGLPDARWYYWARLPLQPVAVWWALFSAGLIRWPFSARARSVGA